MANTTYHKKFFISEVMLIADADFTPDCESFMAKVNNTQYNGTVEVTDDEIKGFTDMLKSKDTLRGGWVQK